MESILKYQIALTSVWWNDDYKEVRRFSSASDQEEYFDLENIFNDAPKVNFDIKDLMRPRIVFKEPNKDVFDVLNSNYLIVKDNHASSVQKYFYYFINTIKQDSGDIYIAECKLDVWQTFSLKVDFGSGLVERAHLNRFVRVPGTTTAKFAFTTNASEAQKSPLLITEIPGGNYDKLLKAEFELQPKFSEEIRAWFKNNIKCWAYVFLDNSAARKFYSFYKTSQSAAPAGIKDIKLDDTKYLESNWSVNGLDERYSILFFPIYKNSDSKNLILTFQLGTLGTRENVSCICSAYSLTKFLAENNGYSYIYNVILSPVNPFAGYIENSSITFNINGSGNLEISGNAFPGSWEADPPYYFETNPGFISVLPTDSVYSFGVINGTQPLAKTLLQSETGAASPEILNFDRISFPIFSLKGHRNLLYEPKLRQTAYTSFKLDIAHIVEREYNFFSVDQGSDFLLTASLSLANNEIKVLPETLRLEIQNNDFAIQTQADLSIPMVNTQLEEYIAQNKTWARIGNVNSDSEKSYWGDINDYKNILSVMKLGSFTNPGGFINTAVMGSLESDMIRNKPGDLKAAPSSVKSTVAEAFRIGSEDQIKIYQRFFQAPEAILQRDADFFYWFGYKYGYYQKFDYFIGAPERSRKYFNYIEGRFDTISGDINDAARRDLTNIIASGVRIWEVDKPDFDSTLENYEAWLD